MNNNNCYDLIKALSKAETRYALYNLPSDRDEVVRLQDALNRLDDEGNNFFDAAVKNGWSKMPRNEHEKTGE